MSRPIKRFSHLCCLHPNTASKPELESGQSLQPKRLCSPTHDLSLGKGFGLGFVRKISPIERGAPRHYRHQDSKFIICDLSHARTLDLEVALDYFKCASSFGAIPVDRRAHLRLWWRDVEVITGHLQQARVDALKESFLYVLRGLGVRQQQRIFDLFIDSFVTS